MKILLCMSSWNLVHGGGPFFSVGNLARALSREGHEVHLLAGDYPKIPVAPPPEGVQLHSIKGVLIPFIKQTRMRGMRPAIDSLLDEIKPDIIHDNGLWRSFNHEVALAASRHKIPRIISLRGNLDPWCLSFRNWKKQIALHCYQLRDLKTAACIHVASKAEARNALDFGLKQTIAQIFNGVDIPDQPANFDNQGTRTALFIGRIHPVKNLPVLIKAWAKVQPEGWCLKLVGPDELGHRVELERLTRVLGIDHNVVFSGPVFGMEKERLLSDAQLSMLVSNSENFGIAAAEALAAGLPVIASKATPWAHIENIGAGWWVEGKVEPIAGAIREATNESPESLLTRGQRGRAWVKENLNWKHIAAQFIETYQALKS